MPQPSTSLLEAITTLADLPPWRELTGRTFPQWITHQRTADATIPDIQREIYRLTGSSGPGVTIPERALYRLVADVTDEEVAA